MRKNYAAPITLVYELELDVITTSVNVTYRDGDTIVDFTDVWGGNIN